MSPRTEYVPPIDLTMMPYSKVVTAYMPTIRGRPACWDGRADSLSGKDGQLCYATSSHLALIVSALKDVKKLIRWSLAWRASAGMQMDLEYSYAVVRVRFPADDHHLKYAWQRITHLERELAAAKRPAKRPKQKTRKARA